ncbi:T9SS type A sorting domain-containing protein, partial [candidate division WOR-3 bacterium]|nr:T9SS type A sorting domain-containing protein [candidate division WOR-3 bacterium]
INRIYIGTNRGLYILTYNSDTIWTKADIDTVEVHEIIPDEADSMLLYAATSNGIYKSEDRGMTWTVWALEGKDVCTFYKGEDIYYAGTYGEGIYKSTDGTTWEEFNDELTHWGYPRFVLRVHSIAGYDGEVIATTDHGVFTLKDNKWVEDNYGILLFVFTDEEIDSIVTFYDTLADKVEEIWQGTIPDVDSDGKVAILITDVQAVDGEGRQLEDYYGFVNLKDYDTTFEYANLADIIYLDYDGIMGTDVQNAFIRSCAELVSYAKDSDEETWLRKGLAYVTFPLLGIENPDIATIKYPSDRDITGYSTAADFGEDRAQSYAMMLYIYEKQGMDKLLEIMNDTANGINSIEGCLGVSFEDMLENFYKACYVSDFEHTTVELTKERLMPNSPPLSTLTSWGVRFFDTNLDVMIGDTLVFNGEDYVPLHVIGVYDDTLFVVRELDTLNRTKFHISDEVVSFALIVYGGEYERPMRFVAKSDVWSPSFAKLVLSQNALADEFIDLYLYVDEKAYNYELEEVPLVKVTMGDTSTMILMNTFDRPGTDSINTIYDARMRLWGTGIAEFNLYRTGDVAGNPIVIAESLSIVRMVASEGGEIVSPEGMLKLFVPKMALDRDRYLTISRYGEEYRIGPMGLVLRKSATLKYRYKGKKPNLYYWDGTSWHKVPVWVDEVNHIIWAEIDKLGTYRLSTQELAQGTPLPTRYEVRRPFPNPMVDVTYIAVALPKASHVTLELYNIVGQKIHTIMDGSMEAGYHLITWDRKDRNGDRLTPGVYFMRIKVGPYEKVHKLVILE